MKMGEFMRLGSFGDHPLNDSQGRGSKNMKCICRHFAVDSVHVAMYCIIV